MGKDFGEIFAVKSKNYDKIKSAPCMPGRPCPKTAVSGLKPKFERLCCGMNEAIASLISDHLLRVIFILLFNDLFRLNITTIKYD